MRVDCEEYLFGEKGEATNPGKKDAELVSYLCEFSSGGLDEAEQARTDELLVRLKALQEAAKCKCWAGRPGAVRMTTKLLAQRAACPVHGKRRTTR